MSKKEITNTVKFAGKGDYEDIAFTGPDWYVLRSDGALFRIQNNFTDSIKTTEFAFPEKGNEFEGLFLTTPHNCFTSSAKAVLTVLTKSI